MNLAIPLSSAILFFTAALALAVAGFTIRRSRAPGGGAFVLMMVAVALWAICDALSFLLPTFSQKLLVNQLAYLGIVSLPVLMLNFALRYTRQTRLLDATWHAALLWLVPLITVGMVATNPLHHLHWATVTAVSLGSGIEFTYGPYFWFHTAYSYLLLIIATTALLVAVVRYPHLYRRQMVALLIGALIPWAGNAVYLMFDHRLPGFDPTTLGFALGGCLYAWALFRYELFNLTPVARDILIESMSDGLLVLDWNNHVVDANPAVRRLLKDAPRAMIGLPVEQVLPLPPGGFKGVLAAYRSAPGQPNEALPILVPAPERNVPARQREAAFKRWMGEPVHWVGELLRWLRTPQGNAARPKPGHPLLADIELTFSQDPLVVVELRISPVYNHFQEQTGWLLVLREITERKRMEAELRLARDTAETASRFKSDFLASMSHEIRTPMNAVIGMTTLLTDTNLNSEQREWVDLVRSSGEALLAIINEILDYARVESGKLSLEHLPYSLRATVEDSLDVVSLPAAEKDIELLYVIEDGTPDRFLGDANRLRQVLVNLLSNAVKFTDVGQVVLSVYSGAVFQIENGAIPADQQWHELRFTVKDSGVGIAPAHIERLFQPFTQVDNQVTRKYGGSGLGLAISKRLVEMMGGRIWVESESNAGATFSFTIWSPEQPDDEAKPAPPILLDEQAAVLAGKTLLIIEPHPLSRQLLSALAEKAGLRVLAAGTASDALALLETARPTRKTGRAAWFEARPRPGSLLNGTSSTNGEELARKADLVLIDHHVSEVESLRTALPGVPIILMSLPRKNITAGLRFSARLLKPVRPARLYAVLAHCLHESANPITLWTGEDPRDFSSPGSSPPAQTRAASLSGPPAADAAAPTPRAERHALRILAAEDNPTNQRVLVLVLNQLGYTCQVVPDGVAVLEALRQAVYDVVLMDMQMPGLDGLQATRLIRETLPAERQPRIIAMTANAMAGDRERCLEAGMDDYLSKPVRNSELLLALSACRTLTASAPTDAAQTAAQTAPQTAAQDDRPIRRTRSSSDEKASRTLVLPNANQPPSDQGETWQSDLREPLTEAGEGPADGGADSAAGSGTVSASSHLTASGDEAAIDYELISNLISFLGEEGSALFGDVVQLFQSNTPNLLQSIEDALQRGDMPAAQQAAHSLKSSSATLGAVCLARAASEMESATREASAAPRLSAQPSALFQHQLARLHFEFSRALRELNEMDY